MKSKNPKEQSVDRGGMKVAFLSFHFGEYSVRLASVLAREAKVFCTSRAILIDIGTKEDYEPVQREWSTMGACAYL